jgi:hypothetical protein
MWAIMKVETEQRHLQDAPHCLLLWRKPPSGAHLAAAFLNAKTIRCRNRGARSKNYSFEGRTTKNEEPLPVADSTQTRPW